MKKILVILLCSGVIFSFNVFADTNEEQKIVGHSGATDKDIEIAKGFYEAFNKNGILAVEVRNTQMHIHIHKVLYDFLMNDRIQAEKAISAWADGFRDRVGKNQISLYFYFEDKMVINLETSWLTGKYNIMFLSDSLRQEAASYLQKGEQEKGIEMLQKVIEANPNDAPTYTLIGLTYAKIKDFDNAIAYMKKAVDVQPGNAKNYFELGFVYVMNKQHRKARDCFKKTLELEPSHKKAQEGLELMESFLSQ